jgi:hypothetical protein
MAVAVRPAPGWRIAGTRGLTQRGDQAVRRGEIVEDTSLSATFEPA